jgi:large subunit ribosomal protein L24
MKIKKGDQIQIIAGKDKGKVGKVLRVIPGNLRIVVEGLNLIKKHMKPKKGGEKGQRIEVPASINISNVMLVCPKCGKLTRVGFKVNKKDKLRICKKCKSEL